MSLEDEFDEIIRQKVEGNKVPFNEAHWEQASRMIANERRTGANMTQKKYYKLGAFTAVVSTLVILSVLLNHQDLGQTKELAQKANVADTEGANKHQSPNTNVISTEKQISQSRVPNEVQVKQTGSRLNEKSNEKSAFIAPVEENSEMIAAEETTGSDHQNTAPPSKETFTSKGLIPNIENGALIADNKAYGNEQETAVAKEEVVTTLEGELNVETMALLPSDLPVAYADHQLIEKQISFLNNYEADYYKKGSAFSRHFIDAELGMAYLLGWQNEGTKDGVGLGWFAGLNYGYFFNSRIGFGAGLQAYQLQNISQPFYSTQQKQYSFGATESQTLVTCNSMLYVGIPFKFYYAISQKLMVTAGVNAAYLISANNSIESSQLSDGVKMNPEIKNEKAIYEGMSSYNLMLTGSLVKQLNNRFLIQAEFNYGLTDLFENNSTNLAKQNSSGIRLGLNYRICTK